MLQDFDPLNDKWDKRLLYETTGLKLVLKDVKQEWEPDTTDEENEHEDG